MSTCEWKCVDEMKFLLATNLMMKISPWKCVNENESLKVCWWNCETVTIKRCVGESVINKSVIDKCVVYENVIDECVMDKSDVNKKFIDKVSVAYKTQHKNLQLQKMLNATKYKKLQTY